MTRVEIRSEYITLSALLKFCGAVMSGGEAKALIHQGGVAVNGTPCTERGRKLRPGDIVSLGGTDYEVAAACS